MLDRPFRGVKTEIVQEERIRVSFVQGVQIVAPYAWHQLFEQILLVMPVVAYMVLFQIVILQSGLAQIIALSGGILCVIIGLMFFMEGVKIGILPLGEVLGRILPQRAKIRAVLIFAFVLGLLAAYGEPVIGSLQIAGAGVDPQKAPLLYTLLLGQPIYLVGCISVGVGVAFVVGMLRYIRGWSIKPIVLTLVGIASVLSIFAAFDPQLYAAMGLAWDCGAVIAGPVSTPLVLSLGVGICMIAGRSDSSMAGLGSVGLMSLFPIAIVLVLIFVLRYAVDPSSFVIPAASNAHHAAPVLSDVLIESLVNGARAIIPVFLFLWLSLRYWLKEKEEGIPLSHFLLAGGFAIFGLLFFNFGLAVGLSELGNQVGGRLPATFHPPGESIYPAVIGKAIVVIFGAVLGYGATLAEPAFNTMGAQVEEITQGAFKKWLFGQAVALGVGVGAGLGVASLVFGLDLLYLLLPPYVALFFLTIFVNEKYNCIAWDGGAVTTGPVTVPLKIAIGIALSHATGFAEGFGIIALASAYPVMNILLLGLYVQVQQRKLEKAA